MGRRELNFTPLKKKQVKKRQNLSISGMGTTVLRTLVLSDGSALRERTLLAIAEIREKIAKSEEEIDLHVSKSEPEFRAWLHQEFKELMAKSHELLEKIAEKQSIFAQVDELIYQHRLHPGEAYELVTNPEAMAAFQKRREKLAEKKRESDRFRDDDAFWDEVEGEGDFDEFMEGMSKEFEKMFGFKSTFGKERDQEAASHSRSSRTDDLAVKRAYREIVKQLHPDRATQWSASEKALWNQAQQAYHHGDLDGLREVLQSLGSGVVATAQEDRVGDLIARLQKLKGDLWERQKTLAQHQRTPAWRFSFKNLKGLLKIRKKTEMELRSDYRELQYQMIDIQEDWKSLLAEHHRWKKHSGGKKQKQIGSKRKP